MLRKLFALTEQGAKDLKKRNHCLGLYLTQSDDAYGTAFNAGDAAASAALGDGNGHPLRWGLMLECVWCYW